MARAPLRPRAEPELLRPIASPVDSYVRPEPSSLTQLAETLAPLERNLQGFLSDRAAKRQEEDAIRGEAAFYQNNAEGYAEAVQKGLIPAHASNTFVRAYKRAQGQVAGVRMQQEFSAAYDAWEGKNSEDPAEFDAFFADFVRTKVGTEDPDILAGILPAVRGLASSGAERHTTYRHEQTYNGSLSAHMAGVNQIIDMGDEVGLTSPEGTDYPAVFSSILAKREEFVASGGRPEDFDKAMVDGVAAKTLALRDPGLLAWFDQKVPGQDYTYGDTPYGRDVKQATLERLEVIGRQHATDEHTRQTREDAAAKDAATRQAIELLAAGEEIPDELLAAGQKVDPTFRVRITEWRKNLQERTTDPEALMSVYDDILKGGGVKAVVDAFNAGVIGNPEDLSKLHTFAKGYEENADRIGDVLGSASARSVLDAIDVRTKGATKMGDPVGGTSPEGFEAQSAVRRMMMEWTIANPDATTAEREEAVARFGKIVMDRIRPDDSPMTDGGDGGIYERPEGESFPNPYTPPPLPKNKHYELGEEPRDTEGGAAEPVVPDATWREGLPDNQKLP